MNASLLFAEQARIDLAHAAQRRLQPFGDEQERLCRIVKGKKSSVTILTGDIGTGKSTFIPAMLSQLGRGFKTLLSHPNLPAITANYNWMTSNQPSTMFACGKIAGRVEFITKYEPYEFGETRNVDLTLTTHSIISGLITNDDEDGLDILQNYRIFFIDDVHVSSVEVENLLLRIKIISQKRDSVNNPIHFILSSSHMDPEPFKRYFEIGEDNEILLKSIISGRSSRIARHYAKSHVPRQRQKELRLLLDKLIKEDGVSITGIIVFLPHTEVDEVYESFAGRYTKYNEPFSILKLCHYMEIDEQYDVISTQEKKIIFTSSQLMVGVTCQHINTVVICRTHDIKAFERDIDQSAWGRFEVSRVQVEEQVSAIGRLSPFGTCHFLFTEEIYNNFKERHPSELSLGDGMEYLLVLYGLFPGMHPIKGSMDLITYPSHYVFMTQTQKLRKMGFLKEKTVMEPIINASFSTTEAGERVIRVPLLNGLARFFFGTFEYGCGIGKASWYKNMAVILAYPDDPIAVKKLGCKPSDPTAQTWNNLNMNWKEHGNLFLEHALLNKLAGENDMSNIFKKHEDYLSFNHSLITRVLQLRQDLRNHLEFAEGRAGVTVVPTDQDFTPLDGLYTLMNMAQWQICQLSKSSEKGFVCKHAQSQVEFSINQNDAIIDYSLMAKKQPEVPLIIFLSISKFNPEPNAKYVISHLHNILDMQQFFDDNGTNLDDLGRSLKLRKPNDIKTITP
ncbi:hypothetical protein BELL_0877g00050 [Botrytis elliptica]|uniref:Uncharacterized protein n=1 Tax=Botrytis elliptica TaxID=278938 RepID=A0A4Z1J1T7_9HELO|nr:hypothetical protein EAE99_009971 [Botrytis elliptica]TGO67655.1 hypothetical protein BELL_0877g00050 [Botrytis elliptica]